MNSYAIFRLACHFDGDVCTTGQSPLATHGWPSGKQRLANNLITLPLGHRGRYSWLQFNLGETPLCIEPLQQHRSVFCETASGVCRANAASGRLVWNSVYMMTLTSSSVQPLTCYFYSVLHLPIMGPIQKWYLLRIQSLFLLHWTANYRLGLRNEWGKKLLSFYPSMPTVWKWFIVINTVCSIADLLFITWLFYIYLYTNWL